MKEHERPLHFLTGNRGKFLEAALVAKDYGIQLKQLKTGKLEIQANRLEEVAAFAARHASRLMNRNVVTEDAGFFVDALEGFPGPYSSYVFKRVGYEGILKMMSGEARRRAKFLAVVAYCEPSRRPVCFAGSVAGTVTMKPRGEYGFGFDPIFMPTHGDGRTFAEMGLKEKNTLSHRAKAFRQFARWFKANRA